MELLTVGECIEALGVGKNRVYRALEQYGVYSERVKELSGRSEQFVTYVDPSTLAAALKVEWFSTPKCEIGEWETETARFPESVGNRESQLQATGKRDQHANLDISPKSQIVPVSRENLAIPPVYDLHTYTSSSTHTLPDLVTRAPDERAEAERKYALLKPLQTLTAKERRTRLRALADSGELGVSSYAGARKLYDYATEGREVHGHALKGAAALLRQRRSDKGESHLPQTLQGLVMGTFFANARATPARVRRIIELNDPNLLLYRSKSSGRIHELSESTILRIRRKAERHFPQMRLALMSADEIKEFRRVWAGSVLAERAAQLWEADFTTCDTFVIDPRSENPVPFRLTVFAAIDIYSGAVPALIFSRNEDQAAVDLMLLQAVHPKPEWDGWNQRWPIYGRPERLYMDNGTVFVSAKTTATCEQLGIVKTHSLVGSSHTRGHIERFFGGFHQTYEKLLPGYAGEDVVRRQSLEIERLRVNTLRWLQQGGPDPYPERLLTENEFKRGAMNWLTSDYHQRVVGGKTPQEHYLETAPLASFAHPDWDELMLLASDKLPRKIGGNGAIRYNNQSWVPDRESLFKWQGGQAVLLVNRLIPGTEKLTIARELPSGELYVHGVAVPLEDSALAASNVAYRAQSRDEFRALQDDTAALKALTDPERTVSKALENAAKRSSEPLVIKPAPRAQLASLSAAERYQKQLEEDRKAIEEEGLKLDWDVETPMRRKD